MRALLTSARKATPNLGRVLASSLLFTGVVCFFIFSTPHFDRKAAHRSSGPCPHVVDTATSNNTGEDKGRSVNCAKLIHGDRDEIEYAQKYNYCSRKTTVIASEYSRIAKNCDKFKDTFGYNQHKVSGEELEFPLAFSILSYENAEQTERLLRAVYRPHNIYCIHIDGKAPKELHKAFMDISRCLPNVIVPVDPVIVHWAEFSVLQAELLCLRRLWESKVTWKYFINLTGKEFPLQTNLELVKILSAYRGANDIDGNRWNRNRDWVDYVWRAENWRTNTHKSPAPHNFQIHKGSAHIVASRAFIDYVLHDQKAIELMEWMRDTRLPDEHYFNTLNHNPQHGVPGAYRGDPSLKPFYGRLKLWWQNEDSVCSGEWSRYICNIGPAELEQVTHAKHLFLNKLNMDVSLVTYECLEQWYWGRTKQENDHPEQALDVRFYKDLKFVGDHV